jgi:hypothetical protein
LLFLSFEKVKKKPAWWAGLERRWEESLGSFVLPVRWARRVAVGTPTPPQTKSRTGQERALNSHFKSKLERRKRPVNRPDLQCDVQTRSVSATLGAVLTRRLGAHRMFEMILRAHPLPNCQPAVVAAAASRATAAYYYLPGTGTI